MSAAPKELQRLSYTIELNPGEGSSGPVLFEKDITIGRLPENDIVIADDPRVSRKHLRVEINGDRLKLTSLNAKNPLTVDGKNVTDFYVTNEESLVQIGKSKIKLTLRKSFGKAEAVPLQALTNPEPGGILRPVQNSASVVPPHTPTKGPVARPSQKGKGRVAPRKTRSKKNLLYILLILLGGGGYMYLHEDPASSPTKGIRTTDEIQAELARAQMQMDELNSQRNESGESSKTFEAAQAYYIRGFRDYRQGQFRRALQSFQAALSFYPEHKLARQYLNLSGIQADRMDRANMQQGRKYRERGRYDLCAAAFQKVMASLKDPQNAVYKEAKVLHAECQTLAEGKY